MEELQGIMFIIIRGMLYASGNTHDQLLNCLYHCLCQGNGHEADFDGDEQVYIIDVYNAYIYPGDTKVKGKTLSSYLLMTSEIKKELLWVYNHNYSKTGYSFRCSSIWKKKIPLGGRDVRSPVLIENSGEDGDREFV